MLGSLVGDAIDRDVVRPLAADVRPAAFRRLVDHGLDDAFRLAAVVLGDNAEAEDAVQETNRSATRRALCTSSAPKPRQAATTASLDREPRGGSSGPVTPLTPMDLPLGHTLWLVGRAASCAIGPGFDPQRDGATAGATSADAALVLQVSVLGIPRRVELPLKVSIVEPVEDQCPPPGWTVSPSQAGSAAP